MMAVPHPGIIRRRWTERPQSRGRLHRYWQSPTDAGNSPEAYATAVDDRTPFLLTFVERYARPDDRILELGCNVGRNLNALLGAGYGNLTGLEISTPALDSMARHFPILASRARIINSSIEDAVETFADAEFDLVFTMAVLEHVHWSSNWVLPHLVRIAGRTMITIEDERSRTARHFPRNYEDVFTRHGAVQVESRSCADIAGLGSAFVARVFATTSDGVTPVA
jgi:SAM-dependent methyltransferase